MTYALPEHIYLQFFTYSRGEDQAEQRPMEEYIYSICLEDSIQIYPANAIASSFLHSFAGATGAGATSSSLETQSTVIISFKSSQTPVQSQTNLAPVAAPPGFVDNVEDDTAPLPCLPPPPPGFGTPTTPHHLSSNVLKKVASFTVEKSSAGNSSATTPNANTPLQAEETTLLATTPTSTSSQLLVATQNPEIGVGTGNSSRRGSSYVPEKLSFAAYEKFEGKFAEIFVFKYSKVEGSCGMSYLGVEVVGWVSRSRNLDKKLY